MLVLAALVATDSASSSGDRSTGLRAAPARLRVLVFSKTTGFRHDSIPVAVAAIRRLGRAHRFSVEQTEDERRFTDRDLERYDAVIFLSTTGEPLAPDDDAESVATSAARTSIAITVPRTPTRRA